MSTSAITNVPDGGRLAAWDPVHAPTGMRPPQGTASHRTGVVPAPGEGLLLTSTSDLLWQEVGAMVRDGLLLTDQAGCVLDANPKAEGLFQRPGQDLRGRFVTDLIAGAPDNLISMLSANAAEGKCTEIDCQGVPADSCPFPAEITVRGLRLADRLTLVFHVRQITRTGDLNRQLLRLCSALDHADEAICVLDGSGAPAFQNRRFAELCGREPGPLPTPEELTALYGGGEFVRGLLREVSSADAFLGETELHTAAGQTLPVWVRAEPVRDTDGALAGIVCLHAEKGEAGGTTLMMRLDAELKAVLGAHGRRSGRAGRLDRDVLDARHIVEEDLAKRTAELERSNRELEHFAYVASHDLQEPLRAITGYLQLLERRCRDTLSEEGRHFIERATAAAARLHELIGGLLQYSRLGTRGQARSTVDCQAVLAAVLEGLKMAVGESRARIEAAGLPRLTASPDQIHLLFQNLLANALKFRGQAPPRIRITARPLEQIAPGEWVGGKVLSTGPDRLPRGWLFTVEDNGIGIPEQFRERVFRLFQRLHTQAEYPGSGIGLALCRRIVENHGGEIWLDTNPGGGSTFYFTVAELSCRAADSGKE